MKADIPDKIKINRGEDGKIHHSYWTTDQHLLPFEDTIYIRKDALMEWANKQKEEAEFHYNHADMNFVREVAFDDLIDKLNSM